MQTLPHPITRDARGRAINAFLRTLTGAPVYVATHVALRGGVWYEPHILTRPTPADKVRGEFGFQGGGDFTIELSADQATLDIYYATLLGREFELTLVTSAKNTDGTEREITHVRRAVVKTLTRQQVRVTLECVDTALAVLDTFYPSLRFTAEAWPTIGRDDIGKLVPDGVATVIKCPLVFVGIIAGKWRYVGLKKRAAHTYALQAVYRDGRLVSGTEYTAITASAAVGGYDCFGLDFVREQRDASGKGYAISYDVIVQNATNTAHYANRELAYLLTQAGIAVDANVTSPAVDAVVLANEMFTDFCYAREWRFDVLMQNLLMILDGSMVATNAGTWRLWQDGPGGASATFEARIDPADFHSARYGERKATFALQYQPRSPLSSELKRTRYRAIGGASGTEDLANPMILRNGTADRTADRAAKKLAALEINEVTIRDVQADFGDRISISGLVSNTPKVITLREIARDELSNKISAARTYVPGAFTYTPQTLPGDTADVYQIDYSLTPPPAPSASLVAGTAISEANAASLARSRVTVRATMPGQGAATLWARGRNTQRGGTLTAEVPLVLTAGNYDGVLGDMWPAETHQILVYAKNANGLEGEHTILAHTSAAYASAPPAPTAVTVAQGTGNTLHASVPAPSYTMHSRVEWQMLYDGGLGGSYVARPNENSAALVERGVQFSGTYKFRARHVDAAGNLSAWVESPVVTAVRNIDDGLIVIGGVGSQSIGLGAVTGSRQSQSYGSVSVGPIAPGGRASFSLPVNAYLCSIAAGGNQLSQKFVLGATSNKNGGSTDLAIWNLHVAGEGGFTAAELTGGVVVYWDAVN